jgi:plastocyanin domain-containing protein
MLTAFSPLDGIVIATAIALILWVNWYFFAAERGAHSAVVAGPGVPEVRVTVRGGYSPATIRVASGAPVRLVFDRQETSSCSEELVMPDFQVRRFLPAYAETTIEITPPRPGTYEFTCGMSMLRGRVVAE